MCHKVFATKVILSQYQIKSYYTVVINALKNCYQIRMIEGRVDGQYGPGLLLTLICAVRDFIHDL